MDKKELLKWYIENHAEDIPSDNIRAYMRGYIDGFGENRPLEEYLGLLVHFGFMDEEKANNILSGIKKIKDGAKK